MGFVVVRREAIGTQLPQVLTVGPGKMFATFAEANAVASNGTEIQVEGGNTYTNDYANITKDITVKGVRGRAVFVSVGNIPNDKAIWVVNSNLIVEDIEMSGATGATGNAAAIKLETGSLTMNRCWVHDCQDGILTNPAANFTILDNTEVGNCGTGTGQTHCVYAGAMNSLTIRNDCYIHDAVVGHCVKSRALTTTISNSRIYDGTVGNGSYTIDISQGGIADIQNNVIQQGVNTSNPTMIAFGAEGNLNPSPALTVSNNILINQKTASPIGVNNFIAGVTAQVNTNTYWGLTSGQLVSGTNSQTGNVLDDIQPLLEFRHPWIAPVAPFDVVEARGVYVANLNKTPTDAGAEWDTNNSVYEAWLGNKTTQTLGYADTGDWSFHNQAFTVMTNWRGRLATRPGLVLRLAIPMLISNAHWDYLLAGTSPPGAPVGVTYDTRFQSINDSIVANNITTPGSAALIRLRIGWESNIDVYPWSHQPASNGFTGSTYSKAKYRAGWRRIAGLFAGARAAGAKLVWNPATPLKNIPYTDHWPGYEDDGTTLNPSYETLIDVIGGDSYDQWVGGPLITQQQRWANMYTASNGIQSLVNFAQNKGKLFSFDEWGIDLDTGTSPTGKHSGDDDYVVQKMSEVMQSIIDVGRYDGGCYWESNSNITSKLSTAATAVNAPAEFLSIWGNVEAPAIFVQQKPVFNWDSVDTPATFYKEFAAHFADGDVPAGNIVEWRKANGTTVVLSQHDNFVYWPSGSLKDASVTVKYSGVIATSGSETMKAYSTAGSFDNTPHGTTALITAQDFKIEVVIGGTTYTLKANNEVTRGGTNIKLVRSGPYSCSWRIHGEFRNGTGLNDTPEGDIWGRLYITFYDNGDWSVWGKIYNGRSNKSTATSKAVTSHAVKNGASTLFSYATAYTLYAGCPVHCIDTTGAHQTSAASVDKLMIGFPLTVLGDLTTRGLYDSMASWWYKSSSTMIANMVNATTKTYIPNAVGDWNAVNGTGRHPYVGPMTETAVHTMLNNRWDALVADRVNALGIEAQQIVFPDFPSSYMPNMMPPATVYSGLSTGNLAHGWGFGTRSITITGGANNGTSGTGATPYDGSHSPLYAYYQYLHTGLEPWLDMMHEQVIGYLGATNPGSSGGAQFTRRPTINGVHYDGTINIRNQVRGIGWMLRNHDDAAWVTPDAHPMKQYILDVELNSWTALAQFVTPPCTPAGLATLGWFVANNDESNNYIAPWMQDYLASTVATALRRGRIALSHAFIQHNTIKWVVGRYVNGHPYSNNVYHMSTIASGSSPPDYGASPNYTTGGPWPQTWDEVWYGPGALPFTYKLTTPASAIGPSGPPLASAPPTGLEKTWTYDDGNTYPASAHAVMVMLNAVGVPGAAVGRDYLANEELHGGNGTDSGPGVSETQWAADVRWRIRDPA